MLSLIVMVTPREIEEDDADRLYEIYPRMRIPLARKVEDSVLIQLPGGDSAQEIRERFQFCAAAQDWPLLPWVAYLGDSNYLRLLKGAVYNFRLVESAGSVRHIPQRDMWERIVLEQMENLDLLAQKSRIPKRPWRTRRNNLQQYLLGDG